MALLECVRNDRAVQILGTRDNADMYGRHGDYLIGGAYLAQEAQVRQWGHQSVSQSSSSTFCAAKENVGVYGGKEGGGFAGW